MRNCYWPPTASIPTTAILPSSAALLSPGTPCLTPRPRETGRSSMTTNAEHKPVTKQPPALCEVCRHQISGVFYDFRIREPHSSGGREVASPRTLEGRVYRELSRRRRSSALEPNARIGRTKAALAAAKARGVKLGGYREGSLDRRIAALKQAADDDARRVMGIVQPLQGGWKVASCNCQ